ncbi:hypothetical protein G1O98_38005 [Nostoc sp. UIC10630]|nr:hypothetical protein [Nostoc sp. UIC 10630]
MLFTGFVESAYWSSDATPASYPSPFGCGLSALFSHWMITMIQHIFKLALYSWTLCLVDTSLGYQWSHLSSPLQALMASRKPGGSAVTPAPGG